MGRGGGMENEMKIAYSKLRQVNKMKQVCFMT